METFIGFLMHQPPLGAGPATQVLPLTGSRTVTFCFASHNSAQSTEPIKAEKTSKERLLICI